MADRAPYRIGLTMRQVSAPGYEEPRDALAQDWAGFMAAALPGTPWMPLPNLGAERITAYCTNWGINGLLLTGGDDPGATPLRDETERALLDWAGVEGHPVLGICRGMQMMAIWAGASLTGVAGHVATRHAVTGRDGTVNSYHASSITGPIPGFRPAAVAEDGTVEAIAAEGRAMSGIMWHPEREARPDPQDIALFRKVFS
ncbi:putative glutamine amidotransferase [Rubricella aquisinus]|uniref:Putative glutamine amidotransferase n=1 Tax=Rubricella aquisinus TaxID=2028108 RepID=A0A840X4N0_9RHOB|nr:gamma-glutamyl-gamma-aminobutyrate hydrolase family protein [Rubricella aquisinus]MBB5515637.1 putative glutamine amidotransferase [Rubricella aquisinus]